MRAAASSTCSRAPAKVARETAMPCAEAGSGPARGRDGGDARGAGSPRLPRRETARPRLARPRLGDKLARRRLHATHSVWLTRPPRRDPRGLTFVLSGAGLRLVSRPTTRGPAPRPTAPRPPPCGRCRAPNLERSERCARKAPPTPLPPLQFRRPLVLRRWLLPASATRSSSCPVRAPCLHPQPPSSPVLRPPSPVPRPPPSSHARSRSPRPPPPFFPLRPRDPGARTTNGT